MMVSASLFPDSDVVLQDAMKFYYDKVTKFSYGMVKAMPYQSCSIGDSHRPTAPSQENPISREEKGDELI